MSDTPAAEVRTPHPPDEPAPETGYAITFGPTYLTRADDTPPDFSSDLGQAAVWSDLALANARVLELRRQAPLVSERFGLVWLMRQQPDSQWGVVAKVPVDTGASGPETGEQNAGNKHHSGAASAAGSSGEQEGAGSPGNPGNLSASLAVQAAREVVETVRVLQYFGVANLDLLLIIAVQLWRDTAAMAREERKSQLVDVQALKERYAEVMPEGWSGAAVTARGQEDSGKLLAAVKELLAGLRPTAESVGTAPIAQATGAAVAGAASSPARPDPLRGPNGLALAPAPRPRAGKYPSLAHALAKLRPDEPWFLLRGQDIYALSVLDHYLERLAGVRFSEQTEQRFRDHPGIGSLVALIKRFEAWQKAHPELVKVPD